MKKISIGIFVGILLTVAIPVFAASDAFLGASYPNVCVGNPIEREEIGGTRNPIAPKYKHLNWLGQLFTADDCGDTRLTELYGGEWGGEVSSYEFGSSVWLKTKPTKYRKFLLKTIGFTCNEGDLYPVEAKCKHWTLSESVPVYKLLLLKPYYKVIKQDDCVNCG